MSFREVSLFSPTSLQVMADIFRDLGEAEIAESLIDTRRSRDLLEDERLDKYLEMKREFCKIGILKEIEGRSNKGIPLRTFEFRTYWFLQPDIRKKLIKRFPVLKDYIAFIEGFYGLEKTVKID